MDEELYKENILEHYRNPRNKGATLDFDLKGEAHNASCGDDIYFYIKFDSNDKIEKASFEGSGCAISQAVASMLTDEIVGKTKDELKTLSPGEIYNMLGIKISPARVNCALLAYEAISHSLKNRK